MNMEIKDQIIQFSSSSLSEQKEMILEWKLWAQDTSCTAKRHILLDQLLTLDDFNPKIAGVPIYMLLMILSQNNISGIDLLELMDGKIIKVVELLQNLIQKNKEKENDDEYLETNMEISYFKQVYQLSTPNTFFSSTIITNDNESKEGDERSIHEFSQQVVF